MLRKLAFPLLCAALCLPAAAGPDEAEAAETAAAADLAEHGFRSWYEDRNLRLYTAAEGALTGTFAVENKADGSLWYSNPPESLEDAVSVNIPELLSLIVVEYYDPENNRLETANSKADSADLGGLAVRGLKTGLRFVFDFPEISFSVTVNVTVNEDAGITVRIPTDKIREDGEYRLFKIRLLPGLCSGSAEDEGFFLLPDGSGAVMNFNNGKTGYAEYAAEIYGGDRSNVPDTAGPVGDGARMPIFGAVRNDSALLAVIAEGAAQSTVRAFVSGVESDRNTAFVEFAIRGQSSYSLDQGWQGKKTFPVYQKTAPSLAAAEVRYFFLSGEKAGLAGMAETCRRFFGFEKRPGADEPAVYLELAGAVTKKESVLGFPAAVRHALTPFDSARELAQSLKSQGLDRLVLRYTDWDRNTVRGKKADRAVPEKTLGGRKAFAELAEYAKKAGIGFFPDVNPLYFRKASRPFQKYFESTRNLNREIGKHYPYKLNLLSPDTSVEPAYLLNHNALRKSFGSFLRSYRKLGTKGLSLSEFAGTVYSDYSGKTFLGPAESEKLLRDLAANAANGFELMLDNPNLFLAAAARHAVDLPEASGFDMTDYGVPFYQMVLGGSVSHAGKPLNLAAEPRKAFLQALAAGSRPHYRLARYPDRKYTDKTKHADLISADFDVWSARISADYTEMRSVYQRLGSFVLKDFRPLGENVTESVFESGRSLVVNLSDEPFEFGGRVLEPGQYAVTEGGVVVGEIS